MLATDIWKINYYDIRESTLRMSVVTIKAAQYKNKRYVSSKRFIFKCRNSLLIT